MSNNLEHPIIQPMCEPMGARLMELQCTNRDIFLHRNAYMCVVATFLKCTCVSTRVRARAHTHTHTHTQIANLIAMK